MAVLLAARGGCLLKLSVTCNGAPAKAGILVSGATTPNGSDLVTTGVSPIYAITETATTTLTVAALADMAAVSKTISTPLGQIVDATLDLALPSAGTTVYNSTEIVKFSPYATTMNVCCVGGGGGGGGGYKVGTKNTNSGGGGGGGYGTNVSAVPITANTNYNIIIGAGGAGGEINNNGVGYAGGTTKLNVSGGDTICQGAGGGGSVSIEGGLGNGNGGKGGWYRVDDEDDYTMPTSGSAGTFVSFTGASYGGGGAGGRHNGGGSSAAGGAPYGASSTGDPGPTGGGHGGQGVTVGQSGGHGVCIIHWEVAL